MILIGLIRPPPSKDVTSHFGREIDGQINRWLPLVLSVLTNTYYGNRSISMHSRNIMHTEPFLCMCVFVCVCVCTHLVCNRSERNTWGAWASSGTEQNSHIASFYNKDEERYISYLPVRFSTPIRGCQVLTINTLRRRVGTTCAAPRRSVHFHGVFLLNRAETVRMC